jgi:hypothetical protein
MRRRSILLTSLLSAGFLLGSAAPGAATIEASASITPYTQQHAHGVASSWSLSWGNYPPYYVEFHYGDGVVWIYSGNNNSANKQHTFYPCVQTNFKQMLYVMDDHQAEATDYSWATEYGGNPC